QRMISRNYGNIDDETMLATAHSMAKAFVLDYGEYTVVQEGNIWYVTFGEEKSDEPEAPEEKKRNYKVVFLDENNYEFFNDRLRNKTWSEVEEIIAQLAKEQIGPDADYTITRGRRGTINVKFKTPPVAKRDHKIVFVDENGYEFYSDVLKGTTLDEVFEMVEKLALEQVGPDAEYTH